MKNLASYATDALHVELENISGFVSIEDAIEAIEDAEPEFDGDSFCPYYHEQVDVINELEREFGNDAEDITGDTTYTAADWQKAQTAYAYAIAYTAFNSYVDAAKTALVDALREFEDDAQTEINADDVKVQLTRSCLHGWATHDRELEDGTMIFESGQLDGCNGMAREVEGIWISCCVDAKAEVADA